MAGRDFKSLRDFPSMRYQEKSVPDDFRRFVKARLMPVIALLPPGKRAYKMAVKEAVAIQIFHNLVEAGAASKCVADSRRNTEPGVRLRVAVWDAIVAAGFAHVCKGSELSGKTARYYWTDKLLELKRLWELRFVMDVELSRGTAGGPPTNLSLVCYRPGPELVWDDGEEPASFLDHIARIAQRGPDGVDPDPRAIENGIKYFREVEDLIDRVNAANLAHSWRVDAVCPVSGRRYAFQPNPMVRQVHCGGFFRAARLYGFTQWSVQNLPQHVRRMMLIDGDPVAELDFSGMAPRMLYHLSGFDPDGDIYRPDQVFPAFHGFTNATGDRRKLVRDFIKRATNICFNVASRAKANSAVGKLLAESPPEGALHGVVYQIEQTNPAGVVDRIYAAHPEIQRHFFTEKGAELMTTDGRIMLRILLAFADAGKPAAGIHDAVVCRAKDAKFAQETMEDAYAHLMGKLPVVDRKY